MTGRVRCLVVGTTAAALGFAGTLVAHADWSVPGAAKLKTRTAAMPRGTKPSVAVRSQAAVISWSAQEIEAGVKMDRYVVTAHSRELPARPDIIRAVVASDAVSVSVTFAASELAGGKWRWTVTPHFASWAGAEGPVSAPLTFAAAAPPAVDAPAPQRLVTATPGVTTPPATPTAGPPTTPPASEEVTVPAPPAPADPPSRSATPQAEQKPAAQEAAAQEPATPAKQDLPPSAPAPSAAGSASAGIPQ